VGTVRSAAVLLAVALLGLVGGCGPPGPTTTAELALGNDVFLEFVKIPAGTFMMGVPDSEEEAVPSVVEG